MEGGMTFLHGDKGAATSGANFSTGRQRAIDCGPIVGRLHNLCREENRRVCRRRTQQLDRIIRRHRARRSLFARFVHQMPSRRPIAVTIEQRADDSAIKDPGKCFVTRLWLPFCDDFLAAWKTPNPQPIRIRRTATPAGIGGGESFLQGLRFSVRHRSIRSVGGCARIGS
jgi:hypothetical protein